jgi:hypothetical protein
MDKTLIYLSWSDLVYFPTFLLMTSTYQKPFVKILGRFISEFFRFSRSHQIPWQALSEFPVYYRYNQSIKQPADVGLPWISHGALVHLQNFIKPEMKVLEFGCGGSTLFFARHASQVISVEDDPGWFEIMTEKTKSFPGVMIRHFPVDPVYVGGEFASNMAEIASTHSYQSYVFGASDIEEGSMDILVIDGRARVGCLRHNLSKLKRDGIVLFDNTDRIAYKKGIEELLSDWLRFDYSGVTVHDPYFNKTSIFSRKK